MDDRTHSSGPDDSPQVVTFDAVLPATMAVRAEAWGVKRASTDPLTLLVLSVLAGADGTALSGGLPYGVVRLLTGIVFSTGLLMVVIAGAELFTGNNLIVMAWANGKVTTRALLVNWIVAFAGNFVGAIATAGLMFWTSQYTFGGGAVGLTALSIAHG